MVRDMIKPLAMGSLYLDKGETLNDAYASVQRMSAQVPEAYGYDIICTHDQLEEAGRLLPLIYASIKANNRQLDDQHIVVGITTNIMCRAGGFYIATLAREADGDVAFLDVNPSRKAR